MLSWSSGSGMGLLCYHGVVALVWDCYVIRELWLWYYILYYVLYISDMRCVYTVIDMSSKACT